MLDTDTQRPKVSAPLDLRNAPPPPPPSTYDSNLKKIRPGLMTTTSLPQPQELKNGFKNFNGFRCDEAAPIEIVDRLVMQTNTAAAGGTGAAAPTPLGNHKKRHRSQMTNIQIAILSNLFGAFEPQSPLCDSSDLNLTKKIVHLSDGHYIDDFVYLI